MGVRITIGRDGTVVETPLEETREERARREVEAEREARITAEVAFERAVDARLERLKTEVIRAVLAKLAGGDTAPETEAPAGPVEGEDEPEHKLYTGVYL
jgi:hypothetical protein